MTGFLGGPKPQAPTPLPDEQKIEAARRRASQEALSQSGRRGTQLTQPATQAGQEFQRKTLG